MSQEARWLLETLTATPKEMERFGPDDHRLLQLDPSDRIAFAILSLADQLQKTGADLGLRDAGTPMGALELLSKEVAEGLEGVSSSASHISNSLDELGSAVCSVAESIKENG